MNLKSEPSFISHIKYSIARKLEYMNQPFPFPQKRWLVVLVPTIWVFLVVHILQPLELVVIEDRHRLPVTIIISLITAIVSAIVIYLFPFIFRNFFDPERWTLYKFFFLGILISILCVAPITLFVYFFYLTYEIKFFYSYFDRISIWLPLGIFIGLVPTFILYFITWKDELNSLIDKDSRSSITQVFSESHAGLITVSKNTREKLTFSPDDFFYAEAQGNYLTIHYIERGEVVRDTLRLTMSQMMDIVAEYDHIMRCHRTFLINVSQVESIKKKGQKHVLKLNNCPEEIPVSKTYKDSISRTLHF